MRTTKRPVHRGPVAAIAACVLSTAVVCAGLTGPARATAVDVGAGAAEGASAAAVLRSASASGPSGRFAILHLLQNGATAYPVSDGYRDDVVVTVLASSASGAAMPVSGTAIVSRAGRTVTTFALRGIFPLVSWNGRDHGAVVPGRYRIDVTARSSDGTERHAATSVSISRKRLQTRFASVRRTMSGAVLRVTPPKAVRQAQQYGAVTVALRTDADVRGAAHLLIRNPALGAPVSLRLRDGVHLSRPVPVPEGSTRLELERRWEPGAATLQDLQVVWTYSTLD